MQAILRDLVNEIHSVVLATVDDQGRPTTCVIDIMDCDESGLYFLTAKGKGLYERCKRTGYVALTGMKGEDTLSRVAISVRGKVREIGQAPLQRLWERNKYMEQIYPSQASRQALTVFYLYEGTGERFDLSKRPIERTCFSIGTGRPTVQGYRITQACNGCKACQSVCPQNCIDCTTTPAVIQQAHCLHCGNCLSVCPQKAVVRGAWERAAT